MATQQGWGAANMMNQLTDFQNKILGKCVMQVGEFSLFFPVLGVARI